MLVCKMYVKLFICKEFEGIVDPSIVRDAILNLEGFRENVWKLWRELPTSTGSTDWYSCTSYGCQMKIQLKINTITDICMVFILDEEHIHDTQTRPPGNKHGIDERIKEIIREYDR